MQRKKDAGAASLKKLSTERLKDQIKGILRILDAQIHVAKLEAQNRAYWVNATWPDVLETTTENLTNHIRELRSRPHGSW